MSSQIPSNSIKWAQREFPLLVLVENIHSPSNVGMIIRICESFGVQELHFIGPYSNVHSDKFRKAARSAEKYINIFVNDDNDSSLDEMKKNDYNIVALEIAEDSKKIGDINFKDLDKIALLIGSERHGVSSESLHKSDNKAHIQQYGNTGSLNVATALSIALYEITNQLL